MLFLIITVLLMIYGSVIEICRLWDFS